MKNINSPSINTIFSQSKIKTPSSLEFQHQNHPHLSSLPDSSSSSDECNAFKWSKSLDSLLVSLALKYKHSWIKISVRMRTLRGLYIEPEMIRDRFKSLKETPKQVKKNCMSQNMRKNLNECLNNTKTKCPTLVQHSKKDTGYEKICNSLERFEKSDISTSLSQQDTEKEEVTFRSVFGGEITLSTLISDIEFEEVPTWFKCFQSAFEEIRQ